jgi:hypothetical protein
VAPEIDVRRLRADDLRCLLAVANTGRLTAAADAHDLAPMDALYEVIR